MMKMQKSKETEEEGWKNKKNNEDKEKEKFCISLTWKINSSINVLRTDLLRAKFDL